MKKTLKKISVMFCSLTLFCTACSQKKSPASPDNDIQFNSYFNVTMSDSLIYRDNNTASVLDYDTMDTTVLCNKPNCSHTTSDCIVSTLKSNGYLPVIYNNCAYYFNNSSSFTEKDGKNAIELKTTLMKYDFKKLEYEKVTEINGFNANDDGILIGSVYYFTTNYGNPKYDDAGNVISKSSGGGGNLLSVDLRNNKVKDYGEIFDYEALKKQYPSAANSTSIHINGLSDSKIYIGIICFKDEITPEMLENGLTPAWDGLTYSFDLSTKEIKKVNDYFSTCAMNGYYSYFVYNGTNYNMTLVDTKNGETIEGPTIDLLNCLTIIGGKVWHDDARCFDIETGEETKVSSYDYGQVIAEYEDSYIFMGTDDNGKNVFEKLPKSDFE